MNWGLDEAFVGTIGSNGTLVLPFLDAVTNSVPCWILGPDERRNPVRWFLRMPELEDAEKFPAPLGRDRRSIRFSPTLVYLENMAPPNITGMLDRVLAGESEGSVTKKCMHLWRPLPDTVHFPAHEIRTRELKPGEALELQGATWWRKSRRRKPEYEWEKDLFKDRSSSVTERQPLSMLCLIKMTWLPSTPRKMSYRVVNGSPTMRNPSTATTPMEPMVGEFIRPGEVTSDDDLDGWSPEPSDG